MDWSHFLFLPFWIINSAFFFSALTVLFLNEVVKFWQRLLRKKNHQARGFFFKNVKRFVIKKEQNLILIIIQCSL